MASFVTISPAEFGSIVFSDDVAAVDRVLSAIADSPEKDMHMRRLHDVPNNTFPAPHIACFGGSDGMVKVLARHGFSLAMPTKSSVVHPKFGVIPKGSTPLHVCAISNALGCAEVLLDAPSVNVNAVNALSHTPIFVACLYKHAKVLQAMAAHPKHKPDLQRGNDKEVDKPSAESPVAWPKGVSPAMAAAALSSDCLAVLLHEYADISLRDSNGYSAVHWAVQYGNAASLQLLLDAGADIDARTIKATICAKGGSMRGRVC